LWVLAHQYLGEELRVVREHVLKLPPRLEELGCVADAAKRVAARVDVLVKQRAHEILGGKLCDRDLALDADGHVHQRARGHAAHLGIRDHEHRREGLGRAGLGALALALRVGRHVAQHLRDLEDQILERREPEHARHNPGRQRRGEARIDPRAAACVWVCVWVCVCVLMKGVSEWVFV
jgi:hypothetical protein